MLVPLLERDGHKVMVHDYGELHLLETTANDNIARLIYPSIRSGDTLVGFSNGAAIISHLQDMGVETPRIVLIQPALNNEWVPNKHTERVAVFWNPGDIATKAGKWYRRLTTLFPWNWRKPHRWGEMGSTGYVGKDKRFVQYNTKTYGVAGHSDWSLPANLVLRELIVSYV